MTRWLPGIALMIGMAAPPSASAQGGREPTSRGVSVGVSLPTGVLKSRLATGYTVAGHLLLRQGTVKGLRFRGDLTFDRWGFKEGDATYRSLGAIVSGQYAIARWSAPARTPYVLGGLGFFNDRASGNDSRSDSNFGVQVGGGVTFRWAGASPFVEARYVSVFAEARNLIRIPVVVGVRF